MAAIQNDLRPVTTSRLARIVVAVLALAAAVVVTLVVARKAFASSDEEEAKDSGGARCKRDPNYYFKDPHFHPYDCQ